MKIPRKVAAVGVALSVAAASPVIAANPADMLSGFLPFNVFDSTPYAFQGALIYPEYGIPIPTPEIEYSRGMYGFPVEVPEYGFPLDEIDSRFLAPPYGFFFDEFEEPMPVYGIPVSAPNLNTAALWAQESIQDAYSRGIIPSELQNNYANIITRAEFCRLAVHWLEFALGQNIEQIVAERGVPERIGHSFADTTEPIILAAYRLGITGGVAAPTATTLGEFNPHGEFDRQQAAVMLTNVYRIAKENVDNVPVSDFIDLDTAASWAHSSIHFVYANGIMRGTSDNIFNPLGKFTRQESIITFNNMGLE